MNSEQRNKAAWLKAAEMGRHLFALRETDLTEDEINMVSHLIAKAALEAAGLNDLVFIRDTLVEAAMPDHPKPGHFSWELSKLRVAYEAALTGDKSNG